MIEINGQQIPFGSVVMGKNEKGHRFAGIIHPPNPVENFLRKILGMKPVVAELLPNHRRNWLGEVFGVDAVLIDTEELSTFRVIEKHEE